MKIKNGKKFQNKNGKVIKTNEGGKKKLQKSSPIVVVINKSGKLNPCLQEKLDKIFEEGSSIFLLNGNTINDFSARSLINIKNLVVEIYDFVEGNMENISDQADIFFKSLKKYLLNDK